MLAASRADVSEAFCSDCGCGHRPVGPSRFRAHRVCMRCPMGMVLDGFNCAQEQHRNEPLMRLRASRDRTAARSLAATRVVPSYHGGCDRSSRGRCIY